MTNPDGRLPDRAVGTTHSADVPELPEPFQTTLEPHRDTIVVVARGEVDGSTVGRLRGQLRGVLEAGFKRIVLDLREVSFMDSSGLHAVLDFDAASRGADVQFTLVRGPDAVQRIFELTGTDVALRFIGAGEVDRAWQ